MNNNTNGWRLRNAEGRVPAHATTAKDRFLLDAFEAIPPEMRAQLQAEAARVRCESPKMTDEERVAFEVQQGEWFATITSQTRAAVHHEAQEQRIRDRAARGENT